MAQVIEYSLPAVAANGGPTTVIAGVVSNVQGTDNYLKAMSLIPPEGYSTSTHNATDNVTFLVECKRGSAADFTLGTFTTTTTDLVAETAVPITVSATAAQQSSLQEGDEIEVTITQNGAGVAVGAGILLVLEIE